jgi:hypothetical protein
MERRGKTRARTSSYQSFQLDKHWMGIALQSGRVSNAIPAGTVLQFY